MFAPTLIEVLYLVAIAYVWSRGSIFRYVRTHGPKLWVALADCPLCSGFWIGVLGHFFVPPVYVYVLGVGSIVGTCALAVFGIIRRF